MTPTLALADAGNRGGEALLLGQVGEAHFGGVVEDLTDGGNHSVVLNATNPFPPPLPPVE